MIATTHPTLNSLAAPVRDQVVTLLNERLADAIDLQLQAKQAHWNVRGAEFIALHRLFDEIAAAATEYADLLAERVVQLGGTALGTSDIVAHQSELPSYPTEIAESAEHVLALSGALAAFSENMRQAIEETGSLGDANAADICTEICRGTDKWLWFVEAHS